MKIKTIKDVDEETWKIFKEMANKRRLKMGGLLREMVKEYRVNPSDTWNKVLNAKPILTNSEARDIKKIILKVRHEHGFRK